MPFIDCPHCGRYSRFDKFSPLCRYCQGPLSQRSTWKLALCMLLIVILLLAVVRLTTHAQAQHGSACAECSPAIGGTRWPRTN